MYTAIAANKQKTILLILLFIFIIAGFGWLFGAIQGSSAIFYGLTIFAIIYAGFGYFFSAQVALALNGARRIEKTDDPRLFRTVENLAITGGLPMPAVYIINDPAPNAFATGRDPKHAAVAATTGLLQIMDDSELEGVIAHELSHVGNYDIRVMGLIVVLVTIVALLSDMFLRMSFFGDRDNDNRSSGGNILGFVALLAALLAPLVAMILKLAVSRQREYLADASGVLLTRYPDGLASALRKIGDFTGRQAHSSSATAHLYISNPLRGRSNGLAHLFSTHPPLQERIMRLETMGKGA